MSYISRRGDIVWLGFDPQAGHEQAGRRPALVVSPELYNRKTRLFPGDQIKSLDWKARHAKFAAAMDDSVVSEVTTLVLPLIDEDI